MSTASDKVFAGSIPSIYESYLVPLIFQPYAEDLARRLSAHPVSSVLEIAAGTGVVTRQLAAALPATTAIVATDLNPGMLEVAASMGTARPVDWRQADAMALPFADASFDAVVCQFGAMFFPDKPKAFTEARRVLRPGGWLLFNVWDRIEDNEFPATVTDALARLFPSDAPRFLARTPHGYHDPAAIERDVRLGGFDSPDVSTVSVNSRARSARDVAVAFCQGTPLRSEIEARSPGGLEEATQVAERAVVERFGTGAIEGRIQALIVAARRPATAST
jgi:SAM-dependent methyltransferase